MIAENASEHAGGFEREGLVQAFQSRERFLTDVLGSLEAFITIDADWRFTFASEAAARPAPMSPDELVGQDARRFPPAGRLQEVRRPHCRG